MKRLATTTHISTSLVGIMAMILLTAMGIGLVPSPYRTRLEARAKLCKALAIQLSMEVQEKQIDLFMALAPTIVRENQDILSMAIRRCDGHLLAATDNHRSFWKDMPANRSTPTHVQVPIFHGDQQFGATEVCFTPLAPEGIPGFLRQLHLPLIFFMVVSGFLAYRLYMKRVLQHLDPSSVTPDRVKATLDTLSESVVVTDDQERIILANEAFTQITGQPTSSLLGRKLSLLPWVQHRQRPSDFPWIQSLHQGIAKKGVPLILETPSGEVCSLVVNTAPISGPDGKQRGIIASFTDVTELEQKNGKLVKVSRLAGVL